MTDNTENPSPAPNVESSDASTAMPRESLREIGLRTGSDKISHHEYDLYYEMFLEKFRDCRDGGIFEIGLDRGRSLALWLEYFPSAFIYGLDIKNSYEGNRHKTFLADQGDLAALKRITGSEVKHPIFLVVDDGSHIPEHQGMCFNYLFVEMLRPGGVYIIEDVEVSYWTRGMLYGYGARYGYKHPMSMIEIFKHAVDAVNDEFLTDGNKYALNLELNRFISPAARSAISTITFGRNCIIVTKKQAAEMSKPNRDYRFKHAL